MIKISYADEILVYAKNTLFQCIEQYLSDFEIIFMHDIFKIPHILASNFSITIHL